MITKDTGGIIVCLFIIILYQGFGVWVEDPIAGVLFASVSYQLNYTNGSNAGQIYGVGAGVDGGR